MSLSKAIYNELIREIIGGKLKVRDVLKEELLASRLNVSRTPVREALAMLEREGLIVKEGKSYVVAPINKEEVIQLYEIRIPLEAEAAKLASLRAKEEELKMMKEVINQIKSGHVNDPVSLAELNGSVHEMIAKASCNKYIEETLGRIRTKLKIVRVTIFTSVQRREDEIREHENVVEAIVMRNPDEAYKRMRQHEENVFNYVKERIIPIMF